MSEEHAVSRRASLKSLGTVGAALVLGGPAAAAAPQGEPNAVASTRDKQPTSVVDVASGRFMKGHS
jgi:hypothetical protein